MERAKGSLLKLVSRAERAQNDPGFFSSESVLEVLKLILAGSPLSEVLAVIAELVESQGEGMLCTIWLPDGDERQLHCAAAPSLPGRIRLVAAVSGADARSGADRARRSGVVDTATPLPASYLSRVPRDVRTCQRGTRRELVAA